MLKRLLLLAASMLAGSSAMAVIVISISDNGADLTMTATGSYDFTGATPTSGAGLANDAVIVPTAAFGNYGWKTPGLNADGYTVNFSGLISQTSGVITPSSFSISHPFFILSLNNIISLPEGAPLTAVGVNNTAVFSGNTLASLGMVPGQTLTVSWPGDSAIIQTLGAIPEPSTYIALSGFAAMGLFIYRRQRQRSVGSKVLRTAQK